MNIEEAEESAVTSGTTKCPKCGFRNPGSLRFCGNCGTKISEEVGTGTAPNAVKCGKCGSQNPTNLKFCGNCGSRIKQAWLGSEFLATRFEALALLHVTGSIYLLISLIVNALVQATYLFYVPYAIAALLGLYAGYGFYEGKLNRNVRVASITSNLVGLVSTFLLFVVGLEVRGVVGPAWVIFGITLGFYIKARDRFRTE
jgi:hypothetical protein